MKALLRRRSVRLTYAEVYNCAYACYGRNRIDHFVSRYVRAFLREPTRFKSIPKHLDTILTTQHIGRGKEAGSGQDPVRTVKWALRVVRFMERRAAKVITRCVLEYLYAPCGPWLRRTLEDHAQSGLAP